MVILFQSCVECHDCCFKPRIGIFVCANDLFFNEKVDGKYIISRNEWKFAHACENNGVIQYLMKHPIFWGFYWHLPLTISLAGECFNYYFKWRKSIFVSANYFFFDVIFDWEWSICKTSGSLLMWGEIMVWYNIRSYGDLNDSSPWLCHLLSQLEK